MIVVSLSFGGREFAATTVERARASVPPTSGAAGPLELLTSDDQAKRFRHRPAKLYSD